ncbi:type IV toxin-antitoxin system AbiEi family antitoxin domain-containing protein [Plantactinospora sp. GCM10030261]|uniref:type IV toxin-antitoxin system AbiEi family antitoxin domain-containing protein n=1 Tax=Plantactinospora sp. GCM10030261 TaxID=3273420 RepID=UPI00362436DA
MTTPPSLRRVAAGQDGVVSLRQALRAGLSRDEVRQRCRAGRWIRLLPGYFLIDPAACVAPIRRARIRAAVASLGRGACAVLETAAELQGIAGLRPSTMIHVSVPVARPRPQRHAHAGLTVHQLTVSDEDVHRIDDIPVTTPLRTLADVILRTDRYSAVSAIDSALHRGLVDASQLPLVARSISRRRGAVAARGYLLEADGRAQSPLETRVRLRCVDGRVPPDDLQVEVRDADGYLLGIGDLGWRRARVIAEADGRGPHGGPDAVFADRWRQNRLVNAGWAVVRFTWADTLRSDYIPFTVRNALAVAAAR